MHRPILLMDKKIWMPDFGNVTLSNTGGICSPYDSMRGGLYTDLYVGSGGYNAVGGYRHRDAPNFATSNLPFTFHVHFLHYLRYNLSMGNNEQDVTFGANRTNFPFNYTGGSSTTGIEFYHFVEQRLQAYYQIRINNAEVWRRDVTNNTNGESQYAFGDHHWFDAHLYLIAERNQITIRFVRTNNSGEAGIDETTVIPYDFNSINFGQYITNASFLNGNSDNPNGTEWKQGSVDCEVSKFYRSGQVNQL